MTRKGDRTVAEQIERVTAELRDAQKAIVALGAAVTDAQWTARPKSGGWSAAECIAHLTMTTESYLGLLNGALAKVPVDATPPARYKMEFGGWLLAKFLEPPARFRSKTIPAFIPEATAPKSATLAAFAMSQDGLLKWIERSAARPLNQAMITSPFNARLKYSAYTALCVTTAHQRRHTWQAERATRGIPW
jgi:hypothetical protein